VRLPGLAQARQQQLVGRAPHLVREALQPVAHRLDDAAVEQLAVLVQHEVVRVAVELLEGELADLAPVDALDGRAQVQPQRDSLLLVERGRGLPRLEHELHGARPRAAAGARAGAHGGRGAGRGGIKVACGARAS